MGTLGCVLLKADCSFHSVRKLGFFLAMLRLTCCSDATSRGNLEIKSEVFDFLCHYPTKVT